MSRNQDREAGRSTAPCRSAGRREVILTESARLFSDRGIAATTIREIGEAVGLNSGTLYHYFKSKDQVLNELFTERWSLLLAAGEQVKSGSGTPREKLSAIAGFIIDSYRHDPELMKVIIVGCGRVGAVLGALSRGGNGTNARGADACIDGTNVFSSTSPSSTARRMVRDLRVVPPSRVAEGRDRKSVV